MVKTLKKYLHGDPVIWAVIILLTIVSVLAVYSSTGTLAYKYRGGNTAYYILKHASFMLIGLILIYVTHLVPYKYYSRLSQLFLFVSIPLLVLTLILGTSLNSASRWLTLPGIGLTVQTSDFAKLALIMYVARMLSQKQDVIDDYKLAFLPIIIPIALVCILILPANFSTSALLFLTTFILMFIGRINVKHLLSLVGIGILAMSLFVMIALYTNRSGRIGTWKHRIENYINDEGDGNYQVKQSKIAIATGGFLGKGPGNSTQRNFLPHPYSDFIYAIVIEEYGAVGAIIVLFLYLYLLFRAAVIVRKCDRTFPAFLTIGLVISLVFQAMINMAVAVNIIPVTGQTLPLISMGGSSILFTGIALGIILSVSRSIIEPGQNQTLEANAIPITEQEENEQKSYN